MGESVCVCVFQPIHAKHTEPYHQPTILVNRIKHANLSHVYSKCFEHTQNEHTRQVYMDQNISLLVMNTFCSTQFSAQREIIIGPLQIAGIAMMANETTFETTCKQQILSVQIQPHVFKSKQSLM